ncbi:MAG: hypothetical protein LQ337_003982 [Flavoplaca oasis]|nr:MAG: hypothetical protein LQ337_003982 [Flavoplaca oasis]
MRTSTVLSVLLAGGAMANPVRKHLEERALVVEHKTVTTVVWVTAGQPQPTNAVAEDNSQKVAVAQGYKPHRHGHGHGKSGDQDAAKKAAEQKAAEQKAAEQKAAEQQAAEQKAAEQKVAEQQAPEQQPAQEPAPQQPAAQPQTQPEKAPEQQQQAPEQKAPAPEEKPEISSPPQSSGASGETGTEGYKSAVLEHHNIHRANHSARALEWDDSLASYAEQVAKKCVYDHDRTPGDGGYGQNIAAGTPAKQVAKILTNAFYNNELELYPSFGSDSVDMSNFHAWGHFSQMVWGSTTKVGCYSYNCHPEGKLELDCNPATGQSYLGKTGCGTSGTGMYPVFTVCNYSPPGNFAGQYSQVKAPMGNPTVTA